MSEYSVIFETIQKSLISRHNKILVVVVVDDDVAHVFFTLPSSLVSVPVSCSVSGVIPT